MKTIVSIVGTLLLLPIWFYLLYKILDKVDATELMWFLYYIYIPIAYVFGLAKALVDDTH